MKHKKLLSTLALSAMVTGALATGLWGDVVEFIRTSGPVKAKVQTTREARHTALRPVATPVEYHSCGIKASAAGETVFSMHPTEEEFAACRIIDGNNDGNTIVYDVHNGLDGSEFDWPVYYNKNDKPIATTDADEWIVTPAVELKDVTRLYTVSVEALTTSTSCTEAFEIVMAKGNGPADLRKGSVIMSEPSISHVDYKEYTSKFGLTEAGTYYFAIHVKSPVAGGWRIALRNFRVALSETGSALPEACEGLTLTPDAKGALKVTVGFTMPTRYINGAEIPANENLEAVITSPAAQVTVSGKRGERIEKQIETVDGNNVITVVACNANGEGMEAKASVICGVDVPVNPVVASAVSTDNMDLHLTWKPVDEGVNGGVVNPEGVTYNVYRYYTDGMSSQWVKFVEGLTECEYTYHATSESQQLAQLMVSAQNSRGESEGGIVSFAAAMLGKPYQLPLHENFEGAAMKYQGLLIDYPDETYTADWALDDPTYVGAEAGAEAALMCLVSDGTAGNGYVELPKFSTAGCTKPRVKLLFYICAATPATTIRIHSTEGRGHGEVLGTIDANTGSGWCEVIYDIPANYCDKGWVVVSADVKCEQPGQVFILGGYDVYESVANDLAVVRSATVPAYVRLGEETPVSVMVQNRGTQAAQTPELKAGMFDGDEAVSTLKLDYTPATLAENEKAEYTGKLLFNGIDQAGKDYTLLFTLPEADADESNNSVAYDVHVGLGAQPVVQDLWGETDESDRTKMALRWTHPYTEGYVDNLEGYAHGSFGYNLGPWKNYDGDGGTTYYSEGLNIPSPGEPKAFQAVNAYMSDFTMYQPSGDSFLMAFCPEGGTADDWLISPEVKGGTPLRFYLTSLANEYPETLEVLYSTTDDELDSFQLLNTVVTEKAGWLICSGTLPENAKYFALHYASIDQFGICIDDIAYSPVVPATEIKSFNVYRDGELIAENVEAKEGWCDFSTPIVTDNRAHAFNVAAVGTLGGVQKVFPLSNTLTQTPVAGIADAETAHCNVVAEKGCITVEGCRGMKVEITDMTGVCRYSVAAAPASIGVRLAPGIYVVTINGQSRKVLVP